MDRTQMAAVLAFVDSILEDEEPYGPNVETPLERLQRGISEREDSIMAELDTVQIVGGWTVGYSPCGRWRLDLLRQSPTNYRVVMKTLPPRGVYDRYWCYDRRDGPEVVVAAIRAWGGTADGEPDGWIKAWDGRHGGRIIKEEIRRFGKPVSKH